jgi:hypothetical protein
MAVVSIKNKLRRGNLLVGNEAYDPFGFSSIATTTLSTTQTTVTFSNIPQIYDHLQIRSVNRVAYPGVSTVSSPQMRFNGDTGSNYSNYRWGTFGSGTFSDYENNQNIMGGIGWTAGATADSNTFGAFIMDIHNYTNTNTVKTVKTQPGVTGTFGGWAAQTANTWYSTAAITEINLIENSNYGWIAGSQFALYGIKA